MRLLDPETERNVSATAAEKGFEEETINQVVRSHQLKGPGVSLTLILGGRSPFGYKCVRKHVLRAH